MIKTHVNKPVLAMTIGVVAALLAICSMAQANQWEHQTSPWQEVPDPGGALNYPNGMAWVLGPNGTTIRSPVETPQPTELTWSIVPGGVAHWNDPFRLTRPMTDINAFGLSTLTDYQAILEAVVNEWTSACGITNAGYVQEAGTVLVGDVPDTDGDGSHTIMDRGFTAGVGHIRFMAYDRDGLNGASSSGQTTYIPEPGSAVDSAYNRRKAGDVRLRSDAAIFGNEGLNGGGAGYYLRRIALHEMGHALGFGHNTVSDSVMGGGSISELGLGEGDIEGALAIYGPVPEPTPLEGDANRDGVVSAGDYGSVQINFADTGDTLDPLLFGDANGDGVVSAGDYGSVQINFGNVAGSAEVTPEPMTMSLLGLGGLALIRRRK